MALFDRIKHGADVTRFKADQLLRINQVQGELGSLRQKISAVRVQIAGTAIRLHNEHSLPIQELEQLCATIDQLNQQIAEKEALIVAIRSEEAPRLPPGGYRDTPTNPCPSCQADMPVDAAFCPNCGEPAPQVPPIAAPSSRPAPATCLHCGYGLEAGSDYCPQCGQQVTSTKPSE